MAVETATADDAPEDEGAGDDAELTEAEIEVEAVEPGYTDLDIADRAILFLANRYHRVGESRDTINTPTTDDENPRVRLAIDMAAVAACERLTRFFGNDLDWTEE